jgi:peptidoglycan-N-acetylglucosamine deacetylase
MRIARYYHAALSRSLSRLPVLLPAALRLLTDHTTVAITIDDGPTAKGTPAVLDALSQARVPGTFFLTGTEAERFPALVRDIVDHGHEVASHGYTHADMFLVSRDRLRDNVRRSLDVIERCCGVRPRWYRPPYGRINPFYVNIPSELGCELVLWSRMPRDFDNRQKGASLLQNLRSVRGGDIVVLHDNTGTRGRLPALIHALARYLSEKDLRAVLLTDGSARQ